MNAIERTYLLSVKSHMLQQQSILTSRIKSKYLTRMNIDDARVWLSQKRKTTLRVKENRSSEFRNNMGCRYCKETTDQERNKQNQQEVGDLSEPLLEAHHPGVNHKAPSYCTQKGADHKALLKWPTTSPLFQRSHKGPHTSPSLQHSNQGLSTTILPTLGP